MWEERWPGLFDHVEKELEIYVLKEISSINDSNSNAACLVLNKRAEQMLSEKKFVSLFSLQHEGGF